MSSACREIRLGIRSGFGRDRGGCVGIPTRSRSRFLTPEWGPWVYWSCEAFAEWSGSAGCETSRYHSQGSYSTFPRPIKPVERNSTIRLLFLFFWSIKCMEMQSFLHGISMLTSTIYRTNNTSKSAPEKDNSERCDRAQDTRSRNIPDTLSPSFDLSSLKSCDNNYSMQRFLAYDDDLPSRLIARTYIFQPTTVENG